MLTILAREELRQRPVVTERLALVPIDSSDGQDFWFAVNGSRDTLRRFLPWVAYHSDVTASARFCEACAMDLETCDCANPRPAVVARMPPNA